MSAAVPPMVTSEAMIRPRNSALWMACSSLALTKKVPAMEAKMPMAATARGSSARLAMLGSPLNVMAARVMAAMIEPT